jgi:spore coat polysaccharide biosynthesis protein SpsF (cytidylyltransferase family)
MRIVAIIQARMGSTRLPGKTLMPLAGQPLLGHILDRVRASRRIHEMLVATTTDSADSEIVEFARGKGCDTYCGSAYDVLDRYYQAALQAKADVIVRITADDPFKDPAVIDLIVEALLAAPELDYASNTLEPTFPEGLDVEAFTWSALEDAWKDAQLPSEREHVTPYIWKHPERFSIENVRHSSDLSRLRWTLDYESDYKFAVEIYSRLYHGQVFGMDEILELLSNEPKLQAINSKVLRNAGYLASLKTEQSS